VTIVDTLPYAIDENASNLDGGVYDPEANTITWTEEVEVSSVSETVSINKQLSLSFINIPHTDRVAVNNVSATIALDTDKTRVASADETLTVAFYGDIVVHYYVEGSEISLINDDSFRGLIGDSQAIEAHEVDGYELLNADLATAYIYQDDAQEITFFYHLIELPPEPENPNTGEGLKILPGVGAGAVLLAGLAFLIKRRRF
jgi:LPXTG-motif cell wall-anchored protein